MTSPNKINIGGKILKTNKYFIWTFIAILFELGKIVFFKIALEVQINVHFVRNIIRGAQKIISGFLDSVYENYGTSEF